MTDDLPANTDASNWAAFVRSEQCPQPPEIPLDWEDGVISRYKRVEDGITVSIETLGKEGEWVKGTYWIDISEAA